MNDAARPLPAPLLRVMRGIDRLTGWIGGTVAWLTLAMVLIGTYNAVGRYLGRYLGVNLSSNAYLELQWYLFSIVFLLAAAYTLREDAHVRVDVLYGRFRPRVRARINMAGTAVLLLPFCLFVMWVSYPVIRSSWRIRETSPDPGGLPRYPLKAMILVCFALLALQGIAELIRAWQQHREGDVAPELSVPDGV
jgi:TRAP-type mannitol/chloroaromatic compound transport system permease small subunit